MSEVTVAEAMGIACEWVVREAKQIPGFHGAIFVGSINRMPIDAPFPESSDVDVLVVAEGIALEKLEHEKRRYRGILLEPAYIARDEFATPLRVV